MQVKIELNNIGKRYNSEWIFRNLTSTISSNEAYVLLGGNGSGKSTLLQVIGGNFLCSEGEINYTINNNVVEAENLYKHVSYATPYLELTEDFTIEELLQFHTLFKPFIPATAGIS